MPDVRLEAEDEARIAGRRGEALKLATELIVGLARAMRAPHLIDISAAHIDGCLYHGAASLDFVEHMLARGGRVGVPTTLNVGAMDLIHPELNGPGTPDTAAATRLMRAHEALGCTPTFTCAPYLTIFRPRLGDQIAWAESNAIVFANSVIGARTNRYGDFIDLAAALTGRAPAYGLHVAENRRARIVLEVDETAVAGRDPGVLAVAVGLFLGARAGDRVAAITGLPGLGEDELKALGAAAASSGAVAMFHAVGITPEAPTLEAALGGERPEAVIRVAARDLDRALQRIATAPPGTPLAAVSLGTPHASFAEIERLLQLAEQYPPTIPLYVNTGRATMQRLEQGSHAARLAALGITVVVDTCTYVSAVMRGHEGTVMTNSGKWAWYAPSNLGVEVAFGSLADCVHSAHLGKVTRA